MTAGDISVGGSGKMRQWAGLSLDIVKAPPIFPPPFLPEEGKTEVGSLSLLKFSLKF
jgi:hypothetical protein